MSRSFLRAWPRMRHDFDGRPVLLLLDFDGTLAPIASTPDRAKLPEPVRELLTRLVKLPYVDVGILSGRALADVRARVGIEGCWYIGNHGLEAAGPGARFVHPAARRSRELMRRLSSRLTEQLKLIPGALVEAKGLSLSLHWRLVPPRLRPRFAYLVSRALLPCQCDGQIWVTRGKRVVEVRPPVNWHKGTIIDWLIQRGVGSNGLPPAPIYFGDDRTDEDAFETVNRLGGCSVFVGPPRLSYAAYHLRGPSDVAVWLRTFARERAAEPEGESLAR